MGYVHDAGFCLHIPPTQCYGDTATWTLQAGQVANTIVLAADATDETANLFIPINPPSHTPDAAGIAVKGSQLTKIEIDYEILIAACDTVTPVIHLVKYGADGADAVVSQPAFTYDPGHDTDDERDDLDEHRMVLNITTPFYIEDDESVHVAIAFDKAGTSTVEFLGARAYFTLRA